MKVVLVAAVAANGVIGDGPQIPWRVPGEQAHFKEVTLGHVLLMGRTTYDSIGRPLPGRTTIVLTRDPAWSAEGVLVAHSIDEALRLAVDIGGDPGGDIGGDPGIDLMVAGGASVYAALLPSADEQVLSEIHLRPLGDVHYPDFHQAGGWVEASREQRPGFDVVRWVRDQPVLAPPVEPQRAER